MKTKLITDVISNETNHTYDMFLQKWVKNIFHKCKHGYKHFACLYVSNGADRPMVTIIGYNNGFTYYRCVYVCVCVCVYGACMRACVCEFYEESTFSVSFRARILTFYILAMTNPKMTIIQRLLATMS